VLPFLKRAYRVYQSQHLRQQHHSPSSQYQSRAPPTGNLHHIESLSTVPQDLRCGLVASVRTRSSPFSNPQALCLPFSNLQSPCPASGRRCRGLSRETLRKRLALLLGPLDHRLLSCLLRLLLQVLLSVIFSATIATSCPSVLRCWMSFRSGPRRSCCSLYVPKERCSWFSALRRSKKTYIWEEVRSSCALNGRLAFHSKTVRCVSHKKAQSLSKSKCHERHALAIS
jgi:hypothetical protein